MRLAISGAPTADDKATITRSWELLTSWLKPPSEKRGGNEKSRSACSKPIATLRIVMDGAEGIGDGVGREAYELELSVDEVLVRASHLRGVLQAFKTLLLLFKANGSLWNRKNWCYGPLPQQAGGDSRVTFQDQPDFAWRGFLMDTAHHFVPFDRLRELLLTIAIFAKINVFHWHLSDDQCFGVMLGSKPALAQRSGSRCVKGGKGRGYYTPEEVKDLNCYQHSVA